MSKIRKQTRLWKTRDRGKVRICDMSDRHLDNTVKMFLRSYRILLYRSWCDIMVYLSNDPPDGAYFAASGEEAQLAALIWGTEEDYGLSLEEQAEREISELRSMLLEKLRRVNANKQTWDNLTTKLGSRKCKKRK